MDWDEGQLFASDQQLRPNGGDNDIFGDVDEPSLDPAKACNKFREFVRGYHIGSIFPYRDQLLQNLRKNKHVLEINLEDLNNFESGLQDLLQEKPGTYLPQFELAANAFAKETWQAMGDDQPPDIQVTLKSRQDAMSLRNINASHVNRLVKVPGIVISAGRTRPKAQIVNLKCRNCGHSRMISCSSAFGQINLPRTCGRDRLDGEDECPLDPYTIMPDKCKYIDQQTLKLQESPEVVPTGEMPRHVLLSCDRSLAGKLAPGTRISVLGIASIFNSSGSKRKMNASSVAIRTPYIKMVGMEIQTEGSGLLGEEEEEARERDWMDGWMERWCV